MNEVVVGDILKGQAKALNQQKNNKNIGINELSRIEFVSQEKLENIMKC